MRSAALRFREERLAADLQVRGCREGKPFDALPKRAAGEMVRRCL